MEEKVYDTLNMEAVKKGYDFLSQNNNLPRRELVIPDYITPKMIRKAIKILSKRIEREKSYCVEVENPRERRDFLRVIEKKDLVNQKLVTDNEGNTKQIRVRPTLLV